MDQERTAQKTENFQTITTLPRKHHRKSCDPPPPASKGQVQMLSFTFAGGSLPPAPPARWYQGELGGSRDSPPHWLVTVTVTSFLLHPPLWCR